MILQNFDFDASLVQAKIKAEKMVDNGLHSRFGLSRNQRVEKALLGCLGEMAFEHLLNQKKVQYQLDNTDFSTKHSDEFDFKINGKKIDVKVAKKTTANPPKDNWTYGYPEEQNPISKDFAVIGWIDFINKQVAFYGWITGSEIAKYGVVTQNSFAGYRYLTPNHEFKWGALNKNIDQMLELTNR